ncbi:MAG: nucleotidyl transferase AbiEii/AbiGii toxin family protein, partial [Nitrososphaeria archaeon]
MLGYSELLKIASLRRMEPWQEERRYVQALVIYSLSGQEIVMKGGTYLWLFHGLNRFSEDLDFTLYGNVLPDLPETTAETMRLFGLNTKHRTVKNDRYTFSFRIEAQGPLYSATGSACYVYVEISKREKPLTRPVAVTLDEPLYEIPVVSLLGMSLEEVLAEKIRAVIRRNTARDLYDLWFLLHRLGVKASINLINSKLSFYNKTFSLDRFMEKVRSYSGTWKGELEPLIFGALPPFDEVVHDV